MRSLLFTQDAWRDYVQVIAADRQLQKKFNDLIEEMLRSQDPSKGTGHPEPLKHRYPGCYSRHLSKKDRLIYRFDQECLYIISIGGHYGDK